MTASPIPQTASSARRTDAVVRPDAGLKTRGEFLFSSDLEAEGMLWGHVVRSPHPHARIRRIAIDRAANLPGVAAVLTHRDIVGRNRFGLAIADQPVLAEDLVRFEGEAVALIAAESREACLRAAGEVAIDYAPLPPLWEPSRALAGDAPVLHPGGNLVRRLVVRRGDSELAKTPIVVTGEYEVGQQDQAALGTESGLAVPAADGGVDLHVSTQWLHADRNQLATILDLPPSKIRMQLAGVGGAFGAKEDLSVQAYLALLALRTGRPVKIVYTRGESFFGHVHRHPARLKYEHRADQDGQLLHVAVRVLLDGGAYASTTWPVTSNAACFAVGPYRCPNVDIEVTSVYTNNPPAGAMRGFGAVQVAFAHESQMDRIARVAGISPLEVRRRNALTPGDQLPTGQKVGSSVPVLALLDAVEDDNNDVAPSGSAVRRPGGAANVTRGEDVVRGIGYAVGFKNSGMPEGIEDYATARVTVRAREGRVEAEVHSAAAELGQGVTAIQADIVRRELGVDTVLVRPADTRIGSAGTSSASRQTYMTGGAVLSACAKLRERLRWIANEHHGHRHPELLDDPSAFVLVDAQVRTASGILITELHELIGDETLIEECVFRPSATRPLDPDTGQGDAHLQFIYAAHRAVVEVDLGTGMVSVVDLTCAQDVGKVMNRSAVAGQMEGGTVQGLGLALMEELKTQEGRIMNGSFTDYLIPTTLDVPRIRTRILEIPDPDAPYGLKGAGEPSAISSAPAVVAAIRDACGRKLPRIPVSPDDIVGLTPDALEPSADWSLP